MEKEIGSLSSLDIKKIHNDYNSHIEDGTVVENFGIVVVLDVLGWKNNVKPNDVATYFHLVNRLRSKLLDTCLRGSVKDEKPNVNISTLSDTIVILINGSTPYNELNIFNHISNFLTESLKYGFMFRGSISRGKYYTNTLNNSFVGETYYEAAKYAESTEWAGVIINDTLAKDLLENNTIKELVKLNIIKYEDIPFKNGIERTKESLVLLPFQDFRYDIKSKEVVYFDFISKYEKLMAGSESNKKKLANTIKFFNYLYCTYWKKG